MTKVIDRMNVAAGGFREKRAPRKVFFGNIDFGTSIHFISDIISSNQEEFSIQQDE